MTTEGRSYDTGVANAVAILPSPPSHWSFSALSDYETCPRRYELARAKYPDIWSKVGYPQRPTLPAIAGSIVHGAVETIVRELMREPTETTDASSTDFVEVMRRLGGYTNVLESVAARVMAGLDANPRTNPEYVARLEQDVDEALPRYRALVQTLLGRLDLEHGEGPETVPAEHNAMPHVLRPGSVVQTLRDVRAEYSMTVEDPRITGRADLLVVRSEGAEIIDFKSGGPSSSHVEQLRFYAVLWCNDSTANPDGLPVRRLAVAYLDEDQDWPCPSDSEMVELAADLRRRVLEADQGVVNAPSAGTVGDACLACTVRGLCSDYWETTPPPSAVEIGHWFDLEGVLGAQHASRSRWLKLPSGAKVLLRTPFAAFPELDEGTGLRLLGVLRDEDPDDNTVVATVTSSTEAMVLSASLAGRGWDGR